MNVARMPREMGPDRSAAPGLNDNIPGMLAGHEMSDLAGVPRQPAPESVAHYGRISEIGAFPEHSATTATGMSAEAPAFEAAGAAPQAKPRSKWALGASVASFFLHVTLFYALAVNMIVEPQEAVEEAGSVISVAFVGDAELDAMMAGDPAEETAPEPEVVEAEPVKPLEVAADQPVALPPAQPVSQPTVVAAEPVQPAETQPVAAVEPQILTSMVPAEPVVAQPVQAIAPEPEKPIEVAEAKPVVAPEEKPAEEKPAAKPPEAKKPDVKKPVDKPKAKQPPEPKEQKPKERKPKGGSGGKQKQDGTRGTANGDENAKSAQNGSLKAGNRESSSSGSAAVANYQGKVEARIKRAVRIPTAFKRKYGGAAVRVSLVINANGGLSNVRVARSSGEPEVDKLFLEGVRRAAPFPPLPAGWDGPTATFLQDFEVRNR